MFKPLELFIGQRYTHSRRRNRFISFISFASMLGIMLGVMVLITILSVMNGFEKELRDRILGVVAHVTVTGQDNELKDWASTLQTLKTNPKVIGAAPYTQKQVMLVNGSRLRGVIIQGIDPAKQPEVSEVNFRLLEGNMEQLVPREYGIVLGVEVANNLGVGMGDKVTVIVPQVQVTPAGIMPRIRRFTVVGVHRVGIQEYDGMTAFIHLEDSQRLFRMPESVSGIRLKLHDLFDAQVLGQQLQTQLGTNYKVRDWSQEHGNIFRAVKTERIAMTLILFLVVGVALFNLVASLMMAVNDKQADIAILKTLGMSPHQVMRIFMIQGSIIGIVGTIVGVILGVLLAQNVGNIVPFIENTFGFKIFPPNLFYVSEIPSQMYWSDVIKIAIAALICSVLVTIYPARRAAKIQPAESLRYE
jgi:lipoprotein-releasing system permease protein